MPSIGQDCYWCGKPITSLLDSCSFNVAPDAASGGTMKPFHNTCLPFKTIRVENTERPPRRTDQ